MNPPAPVPTRLQVRLTREMPFRSQLGCTAALAFLLFAVATIAFLAGREPGKNSWAATVVSGAFALVGLLLLWALIRQWAAAGIPETLVECSAEPIQSGEVSRFCLIQRGPARLKSLRANLLCIEETRVPLPHASAGRSSHRTDIRTLHSETLIEATHLRISPMDVWVGERDFILPADARVTGTEGAVTIYWRIEVWGKGHGLASFMHPFRIDVYRGKRPGGTLAGE